MLQTPRQADLILLTVLLTHECPQASIAVHPIKEKPPITGGLSTLDYLIPRTHNPLVAGSSPAGPTSFIPVSSGSNESGGFAKKGVLTLMLTLAVFIH